MIRLKLNLPEATVNYDENGARSAPALAKSAEPEETAPETGEAGEEEMR